jgi:hypothetical protein
VLVNAKSWRFSVDLGKKKARFGGECWSGSGEVTRRCLPQNQWNEVGRVRSLRAKRVNLFAPVAVI